METGIIIITVWYVLNILWLIYGFTKVKTFIPKENTPSNLFTIVVPFRNEAHNLPKLLQSIEELNYPYNLFRVILINDDSTDSFEIPDKKFQISILNNIRKTNSPKKDAINTAIKNVETNWIITTDADCIIPKNWLKTFDAFIKENDPKMIASGVHYQTGNLVLDNFQQLDLMSLQGTTIGSFGNHQAFMCNGANFAYRKDFFEELKAFEGNDAIASGDDVFLLQKAINTENINVHFLKSNQTLVRTQTEKSWLTLFHQRVRWASKTGNYSGIYSRQLGLSVFVMNLTWIIIAFFSSCCFLSLHLFLTIITLKFFVDNFLILITSKFFKIKINHLILSNLIYPFFSTAVVFYSFFGSYKWKERTFKK